MRRILKPIARFRRAETGALSVEAVIIFPLLVWVYTAMFVFWDAYKTENINLKSAYTVADMISREQRPIDAAYLAGARTIFEFLNPGDTNQQLRVSVVSMNVDSDGNQFLQLVWSQGTEGLPGHGSLIQIQDRIPMMAPGDQVIVVDTTTDWTPLFNVGLQARTFAQTVVTSPRFVPQVLWNGV